MNDLSPLNQSLLDIIRKAKTISGISEHPFKHWEKTCSILKDKLSNETIRIAVTGAMKSGKSTFLNSYLEGDYLEHGAGAVTSIVTRIVSGKSPKAILTFKSIEEINQEIRESIYSFSENSFNGDEDEFDLCNVNDRKKLAKLMDGLTAAQLVSRGTRNPQNALLPLYLDGYENVKKTLLSENSQIEYKGTEFSKYRSFVSDENLSIFLKDIQLEIYSQNLEENLEFGDCQGCDSLNPYHLMMIQDYLRLTHFIIYIVSSRTGLRRADIKFLSMLRKLGILENVFYVINSDLDDHDTTDNLTTLVEKISKDLLLLEPNPKVYTFSCLFNFFHVLYDFQTEKEKLRFNQWEAETALSDTSKKEMARFNSDLKNLLTLKRNRVVLNDNLNRHSSICKGFAEWLNIVKSACHEEVQNTDGLIKTFNLRTERINKIRSMIKISLEGGLQTFKKELQQEINRFFNTHDGELFHNFIEHIRKYRVEYRDFEDSIKGPGLLNTMNLIFQDFKQVLDLELVENVNPEVIYFTRKIEEKIVKYFMSMADSFQAMVENNVLDENLIVPWQEKINTILRDNTDTEKPCPNPIKNDYKLTLPSFFSSARFSARVKTEVMVRFGVFTVSELILKVFNRRLRHTNHNLIKVLQAGVRRMKQETIKSAIDYLTKYRENLKENYIFRLVDQEAREVHNRISDRFSAYTADLNSALEAVSSGLSKKKKNTQIIKQVEAMLNPVVDNIEKIRAQKSSN